MKRKRQKAKDKIIPKEIIAEVSRNTKQKTRKILSNAGASEDKENPAFDSAQAES